MNGYIIKASENRDFFTNEKLKRNEIEVVSLFPFRVENEIIYNNVITSKSNVQNLVGYTPTQEDVDKLVMRNKELLELLVDTYEQLGHEFKSSMRIVQHYKTVSKKFVDDLMTEKEKERYDSDLERSVDLKTTLERIRVNIELLDESIRYSYLEKSLEALSLSTTGTLELPYVVNHEEDVDLNIISN